MQCLAQQHLSCDSCQRMAASGKPPMPWMRFCTTITRESVNTSALSNGSVGPGVLLTKVQHDQGAQDAVAAGRHLNIHPQLTPGAQQQPASTAVCQHPDIRQAAHLQAQQQPQPQPQPQPLPVASWQR